MLSCKPHPLAKLPAPALAAVPLPPTSEVRGDRKDVGCLWLWAVEERSIFVTSSPETAKRSRIAGTSLRPWRGVGAEGALAAGHDCWERGGADSGRCRRLVIPRSPPGNREAKLGGSASCRQLV